MCEKNIVKIIEREGEREREIGKEREGRERERRKVISTNVHLVILKILA